MGIAAYAVAVIVQTFGVVSKIMEDAAHGIDFYDAIASQAMFIVLGYHYRSHADSRDL